MRVLSRKVSFVFLSCLLLPTCSICAFGQSRLVVSEKDQTSLIRHLLCQYNLKNVTDNSSTLLLLDSNLPTALTATTSYSICGLDVEIVSPRKPDEGVLPVGALRYRFGPVLKRKGYFEVSFAEVWSTASSSSFQSDEVFYRCSRSSNRWRCNLFKIRMSQT